MVNFHVIDVPKRLFVLFVGIVGIAPRTPFDEPFSIGGNLSSTFRRILLGVTFFNVTRIFYKAMLADWANLILISIESVVLSFLSLQTPYLLRVWMANLDVIHVPGGRNPGRALAPWVWAVAVLSFLGLLFRSTGYKQLWLFKKIGDALTFIPVRKTLIMYNSVTTSRARYPGRGSILSQIVLVGEYYSLLACLADILFKVLAIVGLMDEAAMKSALVKGFYEDNTFAMFSRVLLHSILINVLDETFELQTSSSSSAPPQSNGTDEEEESSGAEDIPSRPGSGRISTRGGAARREPSVAATMEIVALV